MNKSRLIDLIQSKPCLYDLTNPEYKNQAHKAEVWKEIAQSLDSTVQICRMMWESLKRQYRRCRQHNAQGKLRRSEWKYEKKLEFLLSRNSSHLQQQENVNEERRDSISVLTSRLSRIPEPDVKESKIARIVKNYIPTVEMWTQEAQELFLKEVGQAFVNALHKNSER